MNSIEKSECYVYGHFDQNGRCHYVGKGKGNRAWAFNKRPKMWRTFFGACPERVEIFQDGLSDEDACSLEVRLIAEHRLRGEALANCSGGGEPGIPSLKGRRLSEAHRAAISAAKRGKSNGRLGTSMSEAARRSISKGRLNSDAVKASGEKIWKARRKNGTDRTGPSPKARAVTCLETGATYRCAKEAALATGLREKSIWQCCAGKTKSLADMHWSFASDSNTSHGQATWFGA